MLHLAQVWLCAAADSAHAPLSSPSARAVADLPYRQTPIPHTKINTFVGHRIILAEVDGIISKGRRSEPLYLDGQSESARARLVDGRLELVPDPASCNTPSPPAHSKHSKPAKVQPEVRQRSQAMGVKFRNVSPRTVDVYYDPGGGKPGELQMRLVPGQDTSTNSYRTHKFYFTEMGRSDAVLLRVLMDPSVRIVAYVDAEGADPALLARRTMHCRTPTVTKHKHELHLYAPIVLCVSDETKHELHHYAPIMRHYASLCANCNTGKKTYSRNIIVGKCMVAQAGA